MIYSCLTDTPSANMSTDKRCVTSVTLSLTTDTHSACSNFSLLVNLMSAQVVSSGVNTGGSTYQFDGLAVNTRYHVTATFIYSTSNFIMSIGSVQTATLRCRFPNFINVA